MHPIRPLEAPLPRSSTVEAFPHERDFSGLDPPEGNAQDEMPASKQLGLGGLNIDDSTPRTDEPEIGTFLIADVRGYTRYTQEHGDEAAARPAASFADIIESAVADSDGRLVELRGDEALVVFSSPRDAIRTAVGLQHRFVERMRSADPLPLRVGIGLDAGEAVPVAGGYRGGALNLAARLCSLARP